MVGAWSSFAGCRSVLQKTRLPQGREGGPVRKRGEWGGIGSRDVKPGCHQQRARRPCVAGSSIGLERDESLLDLVSPPRPPLPRFAPSAAFGVLVEAPAG
ncbi:hypothetical protein E2562_011542 [Oryza meyeriana var. granulata]|uniref:Uncharacterized protein n=1 Tax=Oryza meyeriana var. granulata TaxID=110450 RepID=A0A6G1DWC3_9ORYZ|nr:hypothetical protein E2562_011542 [Oryza meyeriana var. granulata]